MTEYHVGTGDISGEIYAGTLSKDGKTWRNRSIVTDEALCAVRNHLVYHANQDKKEFFGYEWTRKDGKKVVLGVTIKELK